VLRASGAPSEIVLADCPAPLVDAVREAVLKWRWTRTRPDAPTMDGMRTPVAVVVRIP
jgi:hypothetical protein